MRKSISLILALTLCVLLARCAQADSGDDPNNNEEKSVTIELTKLDVNETNLELEYKIKNGTDHDVWICDNINNFTQGGFEVFLSEDSKTLLMRRRLDVPSSMIWRRPTGGTYIRLRPGEVRAESLSLNLPVTSSFVFSSQSETQVTQNARSLAIEIGFYDEDLPTLVRSILTEADKFSGTFYADEVKREYFRGLIVESSLGGLNGFENLNKDLINKGQVAIYYSRQALTGEKVLQLKVDGVSIPYEGYVQLTSNANNNEDPNHNEEKVVTIELNKLDVNDTALELSYNIKNNTDHDVWICDSVHTRRTFKFEVFLAEDTKTLVIRRRLDVPTSAIWRGEPPAGRYICLRQGEERPESLSLNLPVQSSLVYAAGVLTTVKKCARCLTLEIGFYDEDLPGLVLSILQEAEKFPGFDVDSRFDIKKIYFRGVMIRGSIGSLSYFEEFIKNPYSADGVYIGYTGQDFTGEQVLRIVVDGVSIPYEGYVQSAD